MPRVLGAPVSPNTSGAAPNVAVDRATPTCWQARALPGLTAAAWVEVPQLAPRGAPSNTATLVEVACLREGNRSEGGAFITLHRCVPMATREQTLVVDALQIDARVGDGNVSPQYNCCEKSRSLQQHGGE